MIHISTSTVRKFSAAFALTLTATVTQAASISLDPVSSIGPTGSQITFNLIANFGATTTTIGGATDLIWDPSVLTFQSFVFDPGFGTPPRDTAFDVLDLQSSSLFSAGFGNFGGISLSSNTTIGRITFDLIGDPGSSASITLSDSVKWSGFYDTNGSLIAMSYSGATASVAAVPIPAAVWLFGSGLLGLIGVSRRSMQCM